MNLIKHWSPVIDKFHAKLSKWKSKTLSFGSRLTLVQSVLGNLPTYFLSLFVAPQGVIGKLESIRRQFLWGNSGDKKKIHWVAWDIVTASKEAGGLGVGMIKSLNISLMVKWWWRLRTGASTIWVAVIKGIHNLNSKPDDYYANNRLPGTWKNIVGVCKELRKKNIASEDILCKRTNSAGESWTCRLTSDGIFAVNALRKIWDRSLPISERKFEWIREITVKVVCFIWRAWLGKIPTKLALVKRGVSVGDIKCSLCDEWEEDSDHVLVGCEYATEVLSWIFKWCGVMMPPIRTVVDLLDFANNWSNNQSKRRLLLGICYGVLGTPPAKCANIIQSTLFLWMKNRKENSNMVWHNWCSNPFSCL
uniref:Reverse transcriptase zinc-binding domain-containing protein n=1 Tax=Lactuca sativa TaxID=4236 RepID=A0A9R1XGL5_LACSA|nr:hypothetical protein LSAT_V11C400201520 [Lactuca sativa]